MEKVPFGRYLLIDRIGAGGMGEIFVALSGDLPGVQKTCALKKIRLGLGHRAEFMGRFWDEVRIAVALSHPNIVNVYEIGCVNQEYFLAMELVEGYDLWRVLSRAARLNKHFSLRAALYVARELLSALDYCHGLADAKGRPLEVVHRDVSPGNVLISSDGWVKLTDFGLALSTAKEVRTKPREVFGKPGYLAPEQLSGSPLDHRVDVYAVGVLLFEMLTGERFVRPSLDPSLLLSEMARRSQVPPSSLRRRVPAKLDRVVAKAVATDPERRFTSARRLHDVLQLLLVRMDPLYGPAKFAESMLGPLFEKQDQRSQLTLPGEPVTQVLDGGSRAGELEADEDATKGQR